MPEPKALKWYGETVKKVTLAAVLKGMDETMSECVVEAKSNTPVDTATLQGSIQLRPAAIVGSVAVGLWGSFSVNYALVVEEGSPPHLIRPKNAKALFWPGASHPVMVVHHPGTKAHHMFVNAADKVYPGLISNIRNNI